jgi:predicted enzyme related to lactoylglutathione lyase
MLRLKQPGNAFGLKSKKRKARCIKAFTKPADWLTCVMHNNHINYVEFPANDLEQTKDFYQRAFGWSFIDYGPEYVAISEAGLDGGFYKTAAPVQNGALVILYHTELNEVKEKIMAAGGQISKDIFSFPGGRRFHFLDPSGNELAVWSDQ